MKFQLKIDFRKQFQQPVYLLSISTLIRQCDTLPLFCFYLLLITKFHNPSKSRVTEAIGHKEIPR